MVSLTCVHSLTSAGVGRTGTYICLDYVMQFIQERALDERLDILKFVLRMRENRCRMVQTDVSVMYLVVLVHFGHKQARWTFLPTLPTTCLQTSVFIVFVTALSQLAKLLYFNARNNALAMKNVCFENIHFYTIKLSLA